MDARTTICNMAVEMSARTGIMAYDDVVADFLPRAGAVAGRAH